LKIKLFVLVLGYPNFSGVNDFDYQPLISSDGVSGGDRHVTSTKRVPLPEELLEQFARIFSELLFK